MSTSTFKNDKKSSGTQDVSKDSEQPIEHKVTPNQPKTRSKNEDLGLNSDIEDEEEDDLDLIYSKEEEGEDKVEALNKEALGLANRMAETKQFEEAKEEREEEVAKEKAEALAKKLTKEEGKGKREEENDKLLPPLPGSSSSAGQVPLNSTTGNNRGTEKLSQHVADKELPPDPPRGSIFTLPMSDTQIYLTCPVTQTPSQLQPSSSHSQTKPRSQTQFQSKNLSTLIILLTNSLGIQSHNNLRLADQYADRLQTMVAVPDLFKGDPIPAETAATAAEMAKGVDLNIYPESDNSDPSQPNSERNKSHSNVNNTSNVGGARTSSSNAGTGTGAGGQPLVSHVKTLAVHMVKGFFDDMWTARHTFESTMPNLRETVAELYAAYQPKKVVVVGYSFGGKYVLHLLSGGDGSNGEGDSSSIGGFKGRGGDGEQDWEGGESDAVICGVVVNPSMIESNSNGDSNNGDNNATNNNSRSESKSIFNFGGDSNGNNLFSSITSLFQAPKPKGPYFDFGRVNKPLFFGYSKNNEMLSEGVVNQGITILERNRVEVKKRAYSVYDRGGEGRTGAGSKKGLPHGFAVPGDYPESVVGNLPDQVLDDICEWVKTKLEK